MLSPRYKFADFVLDSRERTLCKGGETLKLKNRTFQVLRMFVENAGKLITKEEFFESIWENSFVEENNLSVAVAEIRRVLGQTRENRFIQTVPKKGYRFVAEVEQIFEEDEQEKPLENSENNQIREGKVIAESSETAQIREDKSISESIEVEKTISKATLPIKQSVFAAITSHRVLAVIGFASVIFLVGAIWRYNNEPVKSAPLDSIVVLPFTSVNNSPENQLFAEKLTRDLTYNLGRITDVRVSDYEAVEAFAKPDADLSKVETKLKVNGAVVGEIRTNGTETEVAIKINDLRNGAKIWEKRYSANQADLPQIQYRIARDVAVEIGIDKKNNNALTTANYEAFQAYLAGRHYLAKGSLKDLEKAIEHFTAATVKDSSFADAHSALAVTHIQNGLNLYASYGANRSRESFPAAIERAKRALELDPDSSEALAALAFVNYRYKYDWQNAEKNFRRAIEANPNNVLAHRWFGEFLHRTGHFDEGLAEQKTALTLSPNSAQILNEMAWGVYLAGRFDEAVSYIESAEKIDTTRAAALYNASEIYENKGDHQKAFEHWKEAMILEEANHKWIENLETSFQKDGYQGFIRAKTDWLENLTEKDYVFPTDLAKGYTALGEKDKVIGWLEKGVEARVPDILSVKYAPAYNKLKDDGRYQAILTKMNFPD